MGPCDINLFVECDCKAILHRVVGRKDVLWCKSCGCLWRVTKLDRALGECEIEGYDERYYNREIQRPFGKTSEADKR